MTSFYPLLLTRFLFGAGEAGRLPQRVGGGGAMVPAGTAGHDVGREPDGQPGRRRHRPAPGAADSDALRLAHVVLCVRRGRTGVGGGVVRVVPRLARGDARRSPGGGAGGEHRPCRRLPVARGLALADGVGAAGAGLLLHLRLQLLPDLVPHVPGQGPRLQRGRPAALGPAVPGGRGREPGRRRRQRHSGAAARPAARPAPHRRQRPGGRGRVHRRRHAHAAPAPHRGLPGADLRRDHLPAVERVRRVPRHRRPAGRGDGRA